MLDYARRRRFVRMVRFERAQGTAPRSIGCGAVSSFHNMSWVCAMLVIEMPIYCYRCTSCGREVEEIQKFTDPPPVSEDLCRGSPASDEDDEVEQEITRRQTRVACVFERVPTTFTQRWDGSYNNDGRAGWQRQGDAMVRVQQGKNSTKYGEGSV